MIMPVTVPAVIATVGLPASGKTTWAEQQVAQDATGLLTIVNRDHLRAMLRRPYPQDEDLVTQVQVAAIRAALTAGKAVIVDDTNLNPGHLNNLRTYVRLSMPDVSFSINTMFLHTTPLECIIRDQKRPEGVRVGEEVIGKLYARWADAWPQMAQADKNPHVHEPAELRAALHPDIHRYRPAPGDA